MYAYMFSVCICFQPCSKTEVFLIEKINFSIEINILQATRVCFLRSSLFIRLIPCLFAFV